MRTTIIHNGLEYRAFDHLYAVSKCGLALKIATMAPGNLSTRKDGYVSVGRRRLLHRMVATCWLERPDEATEVHHRDENRGHNAADNLEWLTRLQHASSHEWGRQKM